MGTSLKLVMQIAGAIADGNRRVPGDLVEDDPTFHTDVDRDLFNKVPLESAVVDAQFSGDADHARRSGRLEWLFHGLGDHASNSFSVDGQSITDQQSKVFSNQLPSNSIQSIEVISGAPPAEYGGKTSLVIVATTRSGQGVTKPTGDLYASYGAFGSASGGFDLSYGGKNWGNFIEFDGLNTGRFLDPPEFTVFHDKGNEQNFFDRIDYSFTPADSMHLDLNYSRSWFQTPNSYDNLNVQNVMTTGPNAAQVPTQLLSTSATLTSTPRSALITSRPPTHTSSVTIRSSTWARFSAETATATIRARILSPISARPTCKPHPSPSTAPSPTRASMRTTPTSRAFITSRSARSMDRLFCASTTAWASSPPPICSVRPAWTMAATRWQVSPIRTI